MNRKRILLIDLDLPTTRPLSRLRTIFSQRNGIFTEIERLRIKFPNSDIYFSHPDASYEKSVAEIDGLVPCSEFFREATPNISDFDLVVDSENYNPLHLLDNSVSNIEEDRSLFDLKDYIGGGKFNASGENKVSIYGPAERLFFHKSVQVLPFCIFDTREGSIVIDEHVVITPFSYLQGPLYIGKRTKIDNAQIRGGCIIGHDVRAGGEIERALINDYSNKHHEGFLGHSILGSWVNLGALTTTSDLKNNYGEIRIHIPGSFLPHKNEELVSVSTGAIKFGSIIGDCVKTAIGTMLNTGTVLDCGSNVWGGMPDKYLPPFSWGYDGLTQYETSKFLSDCEKIFERRDQRPPTLYKNLVDRIVENLKIERPDST